MLLHSCTMIIKLIVSALAVGITAWFMDSITIQPWWATILVAVVLGLINTFIRPIVKLFSIPVNFLTLGMFSFVINALMVLLCAWFLSDYFAIAGESFERFTNALFFSIVLSIVGWVLNMFAPKKKKNKEK